MALYRQYCDGMFIVASRYLKDTAAAEDALQEAFIKAFQKIHQFKGDVTFGAWLKRIVINTCLDTLKTKKMDRVEVNEETLSIVEEDSWSVPDETTVTEVIQAIEDLKDPYGIVTRLYLLEGYDHQEIAEVLGHKTLSQVKRYSHLTEEHTSSVVASMNERIFGDGSASS